MGEFFEDPDHVIDAVTLVAKFNENFLDIQTSPHIYSDGSC
jgi:hypothetical protein